MLISKLKKKIDIFLLLLLLLFAFELVAWISPSYDENACRRQSMC